MYASKQHYHTFFSIDELLFCAGLSDVMDFRSMGVKEDGVLTPLSLELYEAAHLSYYVTVRAISGASMESQLMSSR